MTTNFVLSKIRAHALMLGFRGPDLDDAVQHTYIHLWTYYRSLLLSSRQHAWKLGSNIDQALHRARRKHANAISDAERVYYQYADSRMQQLEESRNRVGTFVAGLSRDGSDCAAKLATVLADATVYYTRMPSRDPSARSIAYFLNVKETELRRTARRVRMALKKYRKELV